MHANSPLRVDAPSYGLNVPLKVIEVLLLQERQVSDLLHRLIVAVPLLAGLKRFSFDQIVSSCLPLSCIGRYVQLFVGVWLLQPAHAS